MFEREEQKKLNQVHLNSPKVGDYWHEMFCPNLVVVGLVGKGVLVCKTIINYTDGWSWDLSKLEWLSLDDLKKRLSYSINTDRTLADVVPEAHKWVTEEI